ncbi:hypothetical protein J0A67_15830 [Algoriphagus aestuariicola]|jgi:hypothetical protein|uniref:SPOR domain-containing protein n=1 Tax=Algoriphagus aestuariicola TaxID=1852016 RepID=A0ABS3BSS9_9BACT|nr:hypothetical protein [Algoriphagus aestuariicola]MBN7802344.1 hypothetical protein [Algoriphagus aestuariicola]
MKNIWVLGLLTILLGCKSMRSTSDSGSSAFSTYQEDLSSSLPEYPDYKAQTVESTANTSSSSAQSVDGQLDEVQRRLVEKNKADPYFSGFTVLVFSGIDRNQAFKTQDELKMYFPDLNPEMQYQQPRYLVKVGQYTYKIEAQKAFSQIKGQFPSARIIQDRFQRKEYVAPTPDSNAPIQN